MNSSNDTIFWNIFTILLVVMVLAMFVMSPYKETLVCEGNECTVNRSYIIPIDTSSTSYNFKRNDYIEVRTRNNGYRYSGANYLYNNKYPIFTNGFAILSYGPYKIFDLIKSDKHKIKAIKYLFGYKIVNI